VQSSSLDERTAFFLYAICNPENMPKVKTAIREELDKLLQDGVTAEELEIAKKAYLQNLHVARTDDGGLAGTLAANLANGRTMEYYANLEKGINELTPDKVLEVFKRHIDPKKIFIAAAGDFSKKPAANAKPQAAK
jgi:zinc protease